MRASATSKAASPASYYAPQAKADAHKADEASPFALLVEQAAPKDPAKDSTKPPMKDATADQDASQDASQGTGAAQNDQAAATQAPPSKTGKSDKGKNDATTKTAADTARNEQVAAGDAPPTAPQDAPAQPNQQLTLVPPPASLPVQTPADSNIEDGDDLVVDAATPKEKPVANGTPAAPGTLNPEPANTAPEIKTGAPSQIRSQSASKPAPAANSHGKTAAKTQTPAATQPKLATNSPVTVPQSSDNDETDDSAPVTTAKNPQDQVAAATSGPQADTAKVIAPATPSTNVVAEDASQDADEVQAPDTSKSHASASGVQNAAPLSAAARASLANPGQDKTAQTGTIKTDAIKTGGAKPHALPTQASGAADTDKTTLPKSDEVKAAAAQPDTTPAAQPKTTPAPAQDIAAIDAISAPQTPTAAPAAVTQHVQVTAHAAPDLPALAVEIAAKSQSGAKQFDIRLDPPELGRVEVRLSIDSTGKASAHLSADQPQTLSLLQKDAPALTRALRDAGLDVSQNGLNFSLRQQNDNASGNAGNNGRRGSSRNFALSASLTVDATNGSAAYRGTANGRLDIRV